MTTEQILPEGAPTHCDYCSKPPVVWIRGEADIPPGFQDPVHWLVACTDHEHCRDFQEGFAALSRQERGTVNVFRRAACAEPHTMTEQVMSTEQIRNFRRAAMDRGDHHGVSLCNQALQADVTSSEFHDLTAKIGALEGLREKVLRGEA